MYVALYPFFQLVNFQYLDCDANGFTENRGNELYRRSPGVPQETHYRHGCHIRPNYDGKIQFS